MRYDGPSTPSECPTVRGGGAPHARSTSPPREVKTRCSTAVPADGGLSPARGAHVAHGVWTSEHTSSTESLVPAPTNSVPYVYVTATPRASLN